MVEVTRQRWALHLVYFLRTRILYLKFAKQHRPNYYKLYRSDRKKKKRWLTIFKNEYKSTQ